MVRYFIGFMKANTITDTISVLRCNGSVPQHNFTSFNEILAVES